MKRSVISGELVDQRKLWSVSLRGEKKKRGEMMEGKERRQRWVVVVGGGGRRWGTEKGPLSVLNESKRTFLLPPPRCAVKLDQHRGTVTLLASQTPPLHNGVCEDPPCISHSI